MAPSIVPPEKKLFLIEADEIPTPDKEPTDPAAPGPPTPASLLLLDRIALSISLFTAVLSISPASPVSPVSI